MTQEHDAETVEAMARAIYHAAHPKSGEWHWLDSAKQKRFVRQARAALSAMPPREVTGWKPIETAPKGKELLVVVDGEVTTAWFCEDTGLWPHDDMLTEYGEPCNVGSPTHWMPLPPAPEAK